MRNLVATLLIVTAVSQVGAAEIPAPTGKKIVPDNAKLVLLFTRQADIEGGLTEGPAVAPDGSIYFSDIPVGDDKGMIMRFDPKTAETTVFAENSHKSNGLIFNAKGALLACEGSDQGGRSVSSWNIKSGKRTVLADKYQGKKFNAPNDLCVDRQGNIYFSDPRYLGDEPRELEHRAVYRVDTKGEVVEVTHNISKPNGIALSPNGKRLYVADHDNGTDKIDPNAPAPVEGDMKIYAFPLGSDGLVNGERKTIVDFKEDKGCDGMTVDENGNLYLTVREATRSGVMVVRPSGKEIAFIPTGPANQSTADAENGPVGLPSNVEFGIGPDKNLLYITVDKSLYCIRLKAQGFHVQYGDKPAKKKKKKSKE